LFHDGAADRCFYRAIVLRKRVNLAAPVSQLELLSGGRR
jgi:hypothetical protein